MTSIQQSSLSVMTGLDDQDATWRREETDVGENNESQSQLVWPKSDLLFFGWSPAQESKSLLDDTTFNPGSRGSDEGVEEKEWPGRGRISREFLAPKYELESGG